MYDDGHRSDCRLHEAAHAVIACCAGFDIREVVLHPTETRAAEGGRCVLWDQTAEFYRDPFGFLVYACSGSSAEQRLYGHTSARNARDVEIATAAAVVIHDGADANSARVQGALRAAAAIADARMQTGAIWESVQRVADALRRRRRLTGRDVQLLLREAQR
jgi:hypothetical protein